MLPPVPCRNDRYKNSFYPDAVRLWNDVGVELRSIVKLSDFKSAVLEMIRPPKRGIFDVLNPDGIRRIFQLRVNLSPLKAHKKAHNFQDTPSNICLCGDGVEDTTHYLVLCPFLSDKRTQLFRLVADICGDFTGMSGPDKAYCLLYGVSGLDGARNSKILNGTIDFILRSGRFDTEFSG